MLENARYAAEDSLRYQENRRKELAAMQHISDIYKQEQSIPLTI